MSRRARHTVAVLVTEGLPIFELAVPCEVFGIDRSDLGVPWYEFKLVPVPHGRVHTAAGFVLESTFGLDDVVAADTVVVAACTPAIREQVPPEVVSVVRAAYDAGARLVSLCSGAFLLAEAGILDGRPATCHWMNAADLATRYPKVRVEPDVLYTDDGDVITSAGTAASLDACLHVVRRDFGAAIANQVARRLVIPPHREGGQAQFVEAPVPRATQDPFGPVLDWARGRLDEPLTVADLAREARMSQRTLARRFAASTGTTPLQWLLGERVRLAQELLESTELPIERIADQVGLGSAANLRQHFQRSCGVSPQSYRRTFRQGVAAKFA